MRVFDEKRPFYQLKSAMKGKIFLAMAENSVVNTEQDFFKKHQELLEKPLDVLVKTP